MKLTVNNFFWYATEIDTTTLNADRCGNQMRTKGWSGILTSRYNLQIRTMPKESFSGVLIDTRDNNKEIYLDAYTIPAIIKAANEFIQN